MIVQTVTFQSKSYQDVKKLYNTAFPKEERIPFQLLLLRSKAQWIDFLAFYDNDQFCGFTYLTNSDTLTCIMYLAVNNQLQSKGYGSQILQYIREKYKNHTLVLEIEALDKNAANYVQQIRRKKFYFRNGFEESGYGVAIKNVSYEVLKNKTFFQPQDWQLLTKRLSFGLMNLPLYPIGAEQS